MQTGIFNKFSEQTSNKGSYLLKRGTTWNLLKPSETSWNHLETTWNHLKTATFEYLLLEISYSQVAFVLIHNIKELKVFWGKFDPKKWSSPNWLKLGVGVHRYMVITILAFIFFKICFIHIFWANLVPKSNVLQKFDLICKLHSRRYSTRKNLQHPATFSLQELYLEVNMSAN